MARGLLLKLGVPLQKVELPGGLAFLLPEQWKTFKRPGTVTCWNPKGGWCTMEVTLLAGNREQGTRAETVLAAIHPTRPIQTLPSGNAICEDLTHGMSEEDGSFRTYFYWVANVLDLQNVAPVTFKPALVRIATFKVETIEDLAAHPDALEEVDTLRDLIHHAAFDT